MEETIYEFIFEYLEVFNELDFMCHYATKEEYKEMYYECKGPDDITDSKIFKKVLDRILKEQIDFIIKVRTEENY